MPDCGVHYLWFAFVCFLIRSHPLPPWVGQGVGWGFGGRERGLGSRGHAIADCRGWGVAYRVWGGG